METIRILAVDDHEMTTLGYKFILEDTDFENFKVQMDTAKSFDAARQKIGNSVTISSTMPLFYYDIQLSQNPHEGPPPRPERSWVFMPERSLPHPRSYLCLPLVITFALTAFLRSVDPEGYMVKTEIDQMSLQAMVRTVMTSPPYYTQKALMAIRKKMANDLNLDDNDRKILYYLSIGTKTKGYGQPYFTLTSWD